MVSRYLKYSAFVVGFISVLVSIIFGNEHTQFIKPFFHLFIFLFYVSVTHKWNIPLLLFLCSAMVGELLTARDFVSNYIYIVLLFAFYFSIGVHLMMPVVKTAKFKIQITDIYLGLIILIAFVYVVGSIFFASAVAMDDFLFLLIATVAFSAFVGSCFYITAYHSNSHKIYFFIVGIGYMIVCVGTLVHELVMPSAIIEGFVNIVEVISQFCFVYALTNLPEMIKPKKWLI